MPETRQIAEADWALLRDVRLRALADAPAAFGATHAGAVDQPEAYWRGRAGGPSLTLVVVEEGRGVAMGGILVAGTAGTAATAGTADIWGMWTDPGARGRGHGARILDTLLARTHDRALTTYLHVTEGNEAAAALYASRGFVPTGVRIPLREGSPTYAAEMRLAPPPGPAS